MRGSRGRIFVASSALAACALVDLGASVGVAGGIGGSVDELHGTESRLGIEPGEDAIRELCVAEQHELGRDSGVPAVDLGAGAVRTLPVEQYCDEYAALSVPTEVLERAGINPNYVVVNGHVVAWYYNARQVGRRMEQYGER